MFPTTHDITPQFVGESLATIQNLLADGNQILVVTKPHLSVVRKLCRELKTQKEKILFRFTIGSLNPKLADFWEPYAPVPQESIRALRHAHAQGFATSVSVEPMLGSVDDTRELGEHLEPYVTDTIWIGKMQRIPQKLNAHIQGFEAARDLIHEQQTDEEILRLVESLINNPKVRWKDSIKEVIKHHRDLPASNQMRVAGSFKAIKCMRASITSKMQSCTFEDGSFATAEDLQNAKQEIQAYFILLGLSHRRVFNDRKPLAPFKRFICVAMPATEDWLEATAHEQLRQIRPRLSVKKLNDEEKHCLRVHLATPRALAWKQGYQRIRETPTHIADRPEGWTY